VVVWWDYSTSKGIYVLLMGGDNVRKQRIYCGSWGINKGVGGI